MSERVELVDRRTAKSRTFQNPDGSLTTELFQSPIHFKQRGEWIDIDSALVSSDKAGYAWENAANSFNARFKDSLDGDYLELDLGGNSYFMSLAQAAPVTPTLLDQGPNGHSTESFKGGEAERGAGTSKGQSSGAPVGSQEQVDANYDPEAAATSPAAGPSPSSTESGPAPEPESSSPAGGQDVTPAPDSQSSGSMPNSSESPTNAPSPSPSSKAEEERRTSRLAYRGAFRDVDVIYDVVSDGVKETLVLKGPGAPTAYRFVLRPSGGHTFVVRLPGGRWGIKGVDGAPRDLMIVEPPYAIEGTRSAPPSDENPVSMSVDEQQDGSVAINLEVDRRWLSAPQRQFPVRIDPTLTVSGIGALDGTAFPSCSTCTVNTSWSYIYAGATSTTQYRSLVNFDINEIPADADVSDATVKLGYDFCFTLCPPSGEPADLHRLTAAWSGTSKTSDIAFDPTALASWAFTSNYTASFGVTQTVRNWLAGTQPAYGFLVKMRNDALGTGGYAFMSERSGTTEETRWPRLVVTYTSDGVWLDRPTTLYGNGAQLSWSRFVSTSGGTFEKYEVHRSSTPSFVPSASTLVATIRDINTTTFRDTTAAPNKEFSYKIVANSSSSNRQTVMLPADGQATMLLQPTAGPGKSTYIWDSRQCGNDGAYGEIYVGADGFPPSRYRSLVQFDLGTIPSTATVNSATLSLYRWNYPRAAVTINAHRVLKSWKEGSDVGQCLGGVSWASAGDGVAWTQSGGDYDTSPGATLALPLSADPGWDSFDVTTVAQGWVRGDYPNNGMLLRLSDETIADGKFVLWNSDDCSCSPLYIPKLSVTYGDPSAIARGPDVTISSPAPSSKVKGQVTITASAADDRRVDKVEFFKDAVSLGSDTNAPYEFTWSTTQSDNGAHSLTAKATDDAGNTTTSAAVDVTVENSNPPIAALTAPASGATVSGSNVSVSANITDDVKIDRAEFFFDDIRIGQPVLAPPNATSWTPSTTWNTLDPANPAYDGSHVLTVKAYDSHGQVTTSASRTVTVANTSGTKYRASYRLDTSSAVPQAMTYDPAQSPQDRHPIKVFVTNNSTTTFRRVDVVMRYRWYGPDGTVVSTGPDVLLPADLAKTRETSTPLTVDVYPPTLPDGVDKANYTLRLDMFDKPTSTYFAAKGNKPFDNPVQVNKAISAAALGLETYYGYDSEPVGAGMTHLVNVASGNSLLSWTPFSAPGRGMSTVVNLTYSSLEDKSESPVGNNFSLSMSTLTRLGLPLDIHPNKADDLATATDPNRAKRWIEFTDGDGTTHRFNQNPGGGWDEPPGVHLYLREYSTAPAPNPKKWALTRPDGVTFFYNDEGFPTSVEDRNGNKITFTLETIDPAEDPGGVKKRIASVTDAGGRNFNIDYFSKSEAKKPQVRGKVEKITDHTGSALVFDYYEDGNLRRMTQVGGTTATGAFLADRTFTFTYTTSSGSCATPDPGRGGCPAISGGLDARKAADPKTSPQSSRLYSVIDPRGNETVFNYLTSGQDKWKLDWRSNRTSDKTTFGYDIAGRLTTVTPPTPTGEASRQRKFHYDTEGKVDQIIDPLNKTTSLQWSGDRQLTRITEPSGAYTEFAYNSNGYLTDRWDQLRNHTVLSYENVAVDANDVTSKWKAGRSIPHISQLKTKTAPEGGQWVFDYDANGNVRQVADPESNVTAYTYNGDGTIATVTDARGVATTSDPYDFVTRLSSYDGNGFPTRVEDATGGVTLLNYDADGLLRWIQDPNHVARSAPQDDLNLTRFFYDSFHRLGKTTTPKDGGTIIVQTTAFDPNDNATAQSAPGYGGPGKNSIATYDAMDRLTSASNEENETTNFTLDVAGRVIKITEPRGAELTSTDKDFATFLDYDGLDRVVRRTRYDVNLSSGAINATMTTHVCYDALTGDRTSETSPRAGIASVNCASPPPFTTTFSHDPAHRLISVTDPEGRSTRFGYDGNDNVRTITDANDNAQTRTYDRLDRVTKIEQPFDTTVSPTRLVTTKMFYDRVGNLERLISPRAWDASSDKTTFTDFVTTYSYDALNRLTRTELPSNTSTPKSYVHNRYDRNGNMEWTSLPVADADPGAVPASQKTQLTYFDTGWIASQDDPSLPRVEFNYNARGQQTSRKEGNDTAETWDYFDDGMLKSRGEKLGPSIAYTYDPNNNLKTAVDQMGGGSPQRLESFYDSVNRLITVKHKTDADSAWRVTGYSYDLDSNVKSRLDDALEGSSTDLGREQVYGYDAAGWLTSQHDKGTQGGCGDDRKILNDYTRLGLERQRQILKADGSCNFTVPLQTTNWTYFANGKLKTLTTKDRNNSEVESHAVDYTDGGIYVNGFRVKDTFALKGNDSGADCYSTCTETFTYDARDRLIRANRSPGANREYELDRIGNVVTETVNGSVQRRYDFVGSDGLPTTKLEAVLNPEGGVVSKYFYDSDNVDCVTTASGTSADCNFASGEPRPANLLADYGYDPLDRLTRVRSFTSGGTVIDDTTYDYDALDRLTKEVENKGSGSERTTTFTYQGLTDLTTKEILKNASGGTISQKSFTYDAVGNRMSMTDDPDGEGAGGSPKTYTYGYDVHGSVSLLLDDAGTNTVKATYGYKPYGEQDNSLSRGDNDLENPLNPYRYTAKRWDSGSGQLDMGFRRFAPDVARFMQVDVYSGALADLGLSVDPITGGNRYSLAGGNPIGFIEVDGHGVTPDGTGTAGRHGSQDFDRHVVSNADRSPTLAQDVAVRQGNAARRANQQGLPPHLARAPICGVGSVRPDGGCVVTVEPRPGEDQGFFDLLGFAPGLGAFFDLLGAKNQLEAGNKGGAVVSMAAAVPLFGDAFRILKFGDEAAGAILKTPQVSNTKLQNIVRDLYKGTKGSERVGTGTTMDAIRYEVTTGNPVQDVFHLQKGQQYSRALQGVLRKDLNDYDRLVAQSLYDDLQRALRGEI